ncbi:uncharacterized protein TNCV_1268791 [Trichonephila clavipes]|nr:uncharacterized protein TNCV_1268791 [Trichonephila clavipes]
MNATEWINDGTSTSAAGTVEIMQVEDKIVSIFTPDCVRHRLCTIVVNEDTLGTFHYDFVKNPFGHKCDVCDRLGFLCSLKPTKEKQLPLLNNTFPEELAADFKLRATCKNSLDSDKVSTLSRSKGFVCPPKQHGLSALDPISARLVSLRLSFKQMRPLRRH